MLVGDHAEHLPGVVPVSACEFHVHKEDLGFFSVTVLADEVLDDIRLACLEEVCVEPPYSIFSY